jgi:hypothetical protein
MQNTETQTEILLKPKWILSGCTSSAGSVDESAALLSSFRCQYPEDKLPLLSTFVLFPAVFNDSNLRVFLFSEAYDKTMN